MFPEITRDDVFTLETARLWLRWPRMADTAAIVRGAGNKQVAEMTALIPHPYPPGLAEHFVFESRKRNTLGRGLLLAITLKQAPEELIGMVGIRPAESLAPELSYWLAPPHWGQGIATEAARSLVDALFALTDEKEIVASARVINPGSRRVLAKCGFESLGTQLRRFPARGGLFPSETFRLDRRTWESFKTWGLSGLPFSVIERPSGMPESEPSPA